MSIYKWRKVRNKKMYSAKTEQIEVVIRYEPLKKMYYCILKDLEKQKIILSTWFWPMFTTIEMAKRWVDTVKSFKVMKKSVSIKYK